MYNNMWKRFLSMILGMALFFSLNSSAFAVIEGPEENHLIFSDLSALAPNEGIQQTTIDSNGNEAVVGVQKVASCNPAGSSTRTAAAGETWQVWYRGLTIYAEFYMTVSNNKVISVDDSSISMSLGSFSDKSLTKTATYGKLSFNVSGIAGMSNSACWLKGTVTGEDDQIDVTWRM